MTERDIINKLQIELSASGGRLWRTAPGLLWKGKCIQKSKRGVVLYQPTPMKLFPIGEPDCHFYRSVTITQDMVGKTILTFGKAEIKTLAYPKLTKAQTENLAVIARKGGEALIIRETKDGGYTVEEVKI